MAETKLNTWMPFYVGDYLRDTMHLSTVEHGAYMLLIMAYWMKGGPLPNDDEKLGRIAQRSHSEWLMIRQTLSEFFHVSTVWTHKRIEAELNKTKDLTEAKRRAGLKGNLKRWGSSQSDRTAMPVRVANGIANASQTHPPSPSQSHIKEGVPSLTPIPPNLDNPEFRSAWADWLRHVGEKPKAKRPTPSALQKQLERLSAWGTDRAVAAIVCSIEHNWQSIYEENHNATSRTSQPTQPNDRRAAKAAREYPEDLKL